MKRRDFLKGATIAAAASAAEAFADAPQNQAAPDTSGTKPLGKIALEEHFMVPDFVEYFAETYPNISPAIVKPGLEALQDLGDRRIASLTGTTSISWFCLSPAPAFRLRRTLRLR
jgi:hypothetical protein